jgi:hypothetical protein
VSDEKWGWTLEIVKGGPGSGHWGHAGRPPEEGGSLPGRMAGRGRVNPRYFSVGPGRHIVADLTDEQRGHAVAVMVRFEVQPRHLAGLGTISAEPPPDDDLTVYGDDWSVTDRDSGESIGRIAGQYNERTRMLNIRPDHLAPKATEAGGVATGLGAMLFGGSHVFAHELGHHVTTQSEWAQTSAGKRLLLRFAKNLARSQVGISSGEAANMGLRPYSFSDQYELWADIWKVHQFGSDGQKRNLAAWLEVGSLEEVFNGD